MKRRKLQALRVQGTGDAAKRSLPGWPQDCGSPILRHSSASFTEGDFPPLPAPRSALLGTIGRTHVEADRCWGLTGWSAGVPSSLALQGQINQQAQEAWVTGAAVLGMPSWQGSEAGRRVRGSESKGSRGKVVCRPAGMGRAAVAGVLTS
ncbi:hypothetical protein KIL84_009056 [Mauremys mutica]|uniref:Uncharacterized protein n=1 Tax=Mauremys mutica TaxID=74926 RepID=A0A9D3XJE0_9SAUR|nr:hypothetical protein KIL84_009056 [Mauremys mutica]